MLFNKIQNSALYKKQENVSITHIISYSKSRFIYNELMNEAKKGMYSLLNKMDILIFCLFHLSPATGSFVPLLKLLVSQMQKGIK